MKKIFTLVVILLTVFSSFAQTSWQKIALTDKVSVSFPLAPAQAQPAAGQKSFILRHPDSTANFIVAVSDLNVLMGVDAATLAAEMEKEETWEQAKTAFVTSMGPDVKLIKEEMTTIKNSQALKLILERKNEKAGMNTLTVLIFISGTHSMNVIFNNRGGKADKKVEEQFFSSIEIK